MKKTMVMLLAMSLFAIPVYGAEVPQGGVVTAAEAEGFIYRVSYGNGISLAKGTVKEIEEDTIVLETNIVYLEETISSITLERENLPEELQIGDNLWVFYQGGHVDYRIVGTEQEVREVYLGWKEGHTLTAEEKANLLGVLGVLSEEQTKDLERAVTRAELTEIAVKVFGNGNFKPRPRNKFVDTKGHWAEEVIFDAYNKGLVNGISETIFAPDAAVTMTDAVVILLNASVNRATKEKIQSIGYPEGYLQYAKEYHLIEEIKQGNATRGDVVAVLFAMYQLRPLYQPYSQTRC